MTANHVEHEIATFPGSPGRGVGSTRGDAGGRRGLELEHGRTSAVFPSLVPQLQQDAADDIRRHEGER
jgi:hypothetical protein